MIKVVCACGRTMSFADSAAGKKARCPGCKTILKVVGDSPDTAATTNENGPVPTPKAGRRPANARNAVNASSTRLPWMVAGIGVVSLGAMLLLFFHKSRNSPKSDSDQTDPSASAVRDGKGSGLPDPSGRRNLENRENTDLSRVDSRSQGKRQGQGSDDKTDPKQEITKPAEVKPADVKLGSMAEGSMFYFTYRCTFRDSQQTDELLSPHFTPDGKSVIYVILEGKKMRVVVNDERDDPFDSIEELAFSEDGEHFAYIAKGVGSDAAKCCVVVDHKKSPTLDGARGLQFAPRRGDLFYSLNVGGKPPKESSSEVTGGTWYLVAPDGRKGGADSMSGPCFSSDGSTYAYCSTQGGKSRLVINENPGKEFDGVLSWTLSTDGRRFAYVAKVGRRVKVVTNETEGEEYDDVDSLRITRKNDVTYRARRGKDAFAVVNDKADRFESCTAPITSDDGTVTGYFEYGRGASFLHLGTRRQDAVGTPEGSLVFDRGGRRFSYVSKRQSKFLVVLADDVFGEYDMLAGTAAFSPDGSLHVFRGNRGGEWTGNYGGRFISGVVGVSKLMTGKADFFDTVPMWQGGHWFTVVNGRESQPYEALGQIVFNRTGNEIAYAARKSGQWFVVVGENKSAEFDLVSEPQFTADGKFVHFGALSGREWWWRVIKVGQ